MALEKLREALAMYDMHAGGNRDLRNERRADLIGAARELVTAFDAGEFPYTVTVEMSVDKDEDVTCSQDAAAYGWQCILDLTTPVVGVSVRNGPQQLFECVDGVWREYP